jgi:hypothetical protein
MNREEMERENQELNKEIGKLRKTNIMKKPETENEQQQLQPSSDVKKTKVLIFGSIPREIKSNHFDCDLFQKDASTYPFNEHYDQYWIISDKFPPRLSVKLNRNPYKQGIRFQRMEYYQMVEKINEMEQVAAK